MSSSLKEFSNAFQEACLPSILDISISNGSASEATFFNVIWKQTNFEISKSRRFVVPYKFDESIGNPLQKLPVFPIQYDGGMLEKLSPSGTLKACIRKQENTSSKKEEFVLEIFSTEKIVKTINLSTLDKHGSILSDPYFSTLEWSPNEEQLLYVAEKKKVKNEGFFERKTEKEEKKDDDGEKKVEPKKPETTIGEKYNYEENWGELLDGITNTVIVIVDLNKETVEVVDGIPNQICPAQPFWLSGDLIGFTGYDKNSFRLGLRVCECRPSNIYTMNLKEKEMGANKLIPGADDSLVSDHSARINAGKKSIVFIRRLLSNSGNMHRGYEKLMVFDIIDGSVSELLENDVLFMHSFPLQCWLPDDINFVVSNDKDGLNFACIINSQTNKLIKEIPCNGLFGVQSNLIFMIQHELDSAGATLKLATLKGEHVALYQETPKKMENIEYGSLKDNYGIVSYYMVPLADPKKPNMPLVVYPHGGPHVMASNSYRSGAAAFVKLGYAVLLCNYRGSTGFGKDNLEALPGKVGDMDVKDVHNFVQLLLKKFEGRQVVDENNIFIFGGSHGGFIGAHLVGQYPDFYRAASLLNPVTDLSAMMMVTDIPDWTFVESGLPYQQGTIPTPEILSEMVKKSPVMHLKNIKAPVLLLIGGKDLRVPPSQGKSYFRLLKANGKTSKLLYYPEDSHPLMNIESTGDFFVNTLNWFDTHKFTTN